MPGPSDLPVTLSVLDRLIDEEPRDSREPAPTRAQSMAQLRAAVRRDLEWLLNTRRIAVPPDGALKEVNRSLYVYGLPDFTSYALSSPKDRDKLIRQVQSALKLFDPRLTGVRVTPLEAAGVATRTLRFRIEAVLLMNPGAERVWFDTVLELSTGQYEVQNAR